MVQRRDVRLLCAIAPIVSIASSAPDAVALAYTACGATPLAYGLEIVTLHF